MGLAASQARFLHLTSQLASVQRRGQIANEQRTALANQMNALNRSQSNEVAGANPFFTGGGESAEYTNSFSSNKNKNNNGKSSNSYNNNGSFGKSLVNSLLSAVSQYPGAQTCSMNMDSGKLAALQAQDSALEMLLATLGTQEKAMKTEIEAVTKVIDKNVESSFKLMA